ncbi:MAG: CBS and ACT domain-containing protein [Pseudomonadota bacterium]|uniref:CBS domain-containing protein n=1 Tax=Candidatus Desulfatibia profunda TaxID=2841695 RepID=A0A8J6TNL3_9BACT|nr:CBS domain-containing protein [Candidatus Desulfatibia profunda]MBL7180371.1 CBS domain-containing protein [Desulfobacterales bacterium]MBU0698517.1 CBS and ACT domain-containing protein [Pseudomonadota bacterium]
MLVRNWMSTPVITVNAEDYMQNATTLLKEHGIRMLPVMMGAKLVGIVTDRDIKRASASDATSLGMHEILYLRSNVKIKHVMTKAPITVPPDYTVEETAELLLKHKISGVPVVDSSGELVGIITQSDLFRLMVSLTGIGQKGIQFACEVKDRSGAIKEITDMIATFNGRIVSVLTTYETAPTGYRKVYLRAYQIDRQKLPELEKILKEKAKLLYIVDHGENTRTVYD